ncbi:type III restriction enzyme, res subunit [Clostridium magnum DSM 2767]|uniref:Type III restriction enzyme, res subunit n=1 Tax=Clostridium magnum DSM 2767 TaxID=1121326 RepID=A0A162QK69_9CLOT|nr:type III restriction enzyme, res subunit [Clostridium magnum DSM 2767]SHI15205.1 Type III restriction enzyme, res subunit [Clostridium magnum DSM 2767]
MLSQIKACNELIKSLSKLADEKNIAGLKIDEEGEILTALYSKINSIKAIKETKAVRPVTSLSQSSLFTGSKQEPDMMSEIKKEILCCDSIDMLVSFIKWSGLRCIIEELREFTEKENHKLRIITTSYIGSSNLSNAALTSGLEWNIKVTEKDSFDTIRKLEATFESYWNDDEFTSFNGIFEEDKKRLITSLKREGKFEGNSDTIFSLDIHPWIRSTKNQMGSKTPSDPSFHFIAHREEILKQSRDTFRAILKDNNFGDLYVGGNTPEAIDHLFMSIQSFNSTKLYEKTTADFYDFIIVDEVHHA